MADEPSALRRVLWRDAFPFLRLFGTFGLAVNFTRLALAFLGVVALYAGGRALDSVWVAGDGGVAPGAIAAFATRSAAEFEQWRVVQQAAYEAARAEREAATERGADASAALQLINTLVDERLAALDREEARDRDLRRMAVLRAADQLSFRIAGLPSNERFEGGVVDDEVVFLLRAAPEDQAANLTAALAQGAAAAQVVALEPQGPFETQLLYQLRCLAGAVQGALTLNIGWADSAFSERPSLIGSLASAYSGWVWLVTERPVFLLVYAVLELAIFALFGVAIARHCAVYIARDESIGFGAALRFAAEKWYECCAAPVIPIVIIVIGAVAMFAGGLIGAIPVIGPIISGALFILAILGGFVLALVLVGYVLGMPLMWPTIAVESSDAFDAVAHAFSYVGQRLWHVLFYFACLLVSGALGFLLVQLLATLTLKFTHAFIGTGYSLFGAVSSAQTASFSKLEALWFMPAWSELPWLPTPGAPPFWGEFGVAPLAWHESVAQFFIATWVFVIVSIVLAYLVSFYFCGATQAYLLLRRDVDATDYHEIYYEDDEDEPLPSELTSESSGTSLPVVSNAPSDPPNDPSESDSADDQSKA